MLMLKRNRTGSHLAACCDKRSHLRRFRVHGWLRAVLAYKLLRSRHAQPSRSPGWIMKPAEILVIDDEPEMASLVADIARSRGHRATCASNPAAAMLLLDDGGFDLVVTDVRMPDIDGIELIERIARLDQRIAVVAISAFGTAQTARRAIRAGALEYLPKPFQPEDLVRCIDRALQRESDGAAVPR